MLRSRSQVKGQGHSIEKRDFFTRKKILSQVLLVFDLFANKCQPVFFWHSSFIPIKGYNTGRWAHFNVKLHFYQQILLEWFRNGNTLVIYHGQECIPNLWIWLGSHLDLAWILGLMVTPFQSLLPCLQIKRNDTHHAHILMVCSLCTMVLCWQVSPLHVYSRPMCSFIWL